jgi:PKHD-type hydroxylase
MILLDAVLSAADLDLVRARLEALSWRDGRATAGMTARSVKRNEQAAGPEGELRALEGFVRAALERHAAFQAAAYPRRFSRMLFSRYGDGMEYGAHTDDAVMGVGAERLRTDLAFTLFLAPSDSYEGGALVVETPLGEQEFRLEAGQAILYGAGTVHRVAPVTRGVRLACVGWVESMVAGVTERGVLFDLAQARAAAAADGAGPRTLLQLDAVRGGLLRLWAQA